jgi:hypothetical protein
MVVKLKKIIDTNIGAEFHNKVSGVRFNSPVFYCNDKNSLCIVETNNEFTLFKIRS